jgi:hypothetical protein
MKIVSAYSLLIEKKNKRYTIYMFINFIFLHFDCYAFFFPLEIY